MKGMWRILFVSCFYAFATLNVANAVDCSTFTTRETCETDANKGCIYTDISSECRDCGSKSYRLKQNDGTYICKSCDNGPKDENNKECGADDAACQYTGNNGDSPNCPWEMTCPDKPGFEHGTWGPDSGTITYTGTGEAPQCTYENTNNVICDTNESNPCESYRFNQGQGLCISRASSCSYDGNPHKQGIELYPNDIDCFASADLCESNEAFLKKFSCGDTHYGFCVRNSIVCANNVATLNCINNGGTISGEAFWKPDLNNYDYTTCKCTYRESINKNDDTSEQIIGTRERVCSYDLAGLSIDGNCGEWKVVECDLGYCGVDTRDGTPSTNGNDATCMLAPKGYYNGAPISYGETSAICNKCPAGATTTGEGATSELECKYTGDTVFQDTDGTFTLPITGTVTSIDWSWY